MWNYSGKIQNRECLLGKIENNEMIFSDFGKIAKNKWYKSFEIRQELILDEFARRDVRPCVSTIQPIQTNRNNPNNQNKPQTNPNYP